MRALGPLLTGRWVSRMTARIAVIVATYNRSESLIRVLTALSEQSLKPNLVVVVDSSESSDLANASLPVGLEIKFLRSDIRSLTVQKNIALDYLANHWVGDYIQVLDDDTYPSVSFLQILSEFLTKHPESSGCSGMCLQTSLGGLSSFYHKPRGLALVKKIVFWLIGLESFKPGSVTWGGVGIFADPTPASSETEWLQGTSMWRASTFNKLRYCSKLKGSALVEDLEFSIRARKLGALYVVSTAHLYHGYSEVNRPDSILHYYRFARNRYFLYGKRRDGGLFFLGYFVSTLFLSIGFFAQWFLTFGSLSQKRDEASALLQGLRHAIMNKDPL
jgi:GT2 family glycosyltransferase